MMEATVPALSSTDLTSGLTGEDSVNVISGEPCVNGLSHGDQSGEQVESSPIKSCDPSLISGSILIFKEDSITATKQHDTLETSKCDILHQATSEQKTTLDGTKVSAQVIKERSIEICKENVASNDIEASKDNSIEEDDGNVKLINVGECMQEEEMEENKSPSPQKSERPKRDVQRRSVFEMLQSEIDEDDEDFGDVAGADDGGDGRLNGSKDSGTGGKKKRKNRDEDSELDLDELNDDDDEDFTADNQQKKTLAKKKATPPTNKMEEKILVLFDDDDLPLKGKRSGGRPKKKKTEDDDLPSDDGLEWHRTGKITGKLFQDDDDDNDDHIDFTYSYRQQQQPSSSDKKLLTSSNKRALEGSVKKQSSSKKIKIDVQGWKFSKSRDGMDAKPKSRISSGLTIQHHQSSAHHASGTGSSNSHAQKGIIEDSRLGSSSDLSEELRRKQSILTIWEQKLRHLDKELDERVAIIRQNEGRVLREERRLKEFEATLSYREKLISSCEEFIASGNSGGINSEDVVEKMAALKRDYEKYRKLAEEHKKWIDKEHQRLEAHASDRSFIEEDGSVSAKKEIASQLPSMETKEETEEHLKDTPQKPNQGEDAVDHMIGEVATPPEEEMKVEG